MEKLETDGGWYPFKDLEPPGWLLKRRGDGTLVRSYPGQLSVIFLAAAADVLVTWWPQLRRCKHAPCRAWFLPRHGRQVYHNADCSYKARWSKFASKRERNYREEYEKRLEREKKRGARSPKRRKQ